MTAAVVAAATLCAAGVGFALGLLWSLRSEAVRRREDEAHLLRVMRLAKLTIDLAGSTGVTLAQAEHAITKALQVYPSKRAR